MRAGSWLDRLLTLRACRAIDHTPEATTIQAPRALVVESPSATVGSGQTGKRPPVHRPKTMPYICDGNCGATVFVAAGGDTLNRHGWYFVLTPPEYPTIRACSVACLHVAIDQPAPPETEATS